MNDRIVTDLALELWSTTNLHSHLADNWDKLTMTEQWRWKDSAERILYHLMESGIISEEKLYESK